MDIKKALLVKSLKGLLAITQLVSVTTTNASHRYPRGRYQYKYLPFVEGTIENCSIFSDLKK